MAQNESGFASLADLAALETDEIAILTSRLPEPGMFVVRGVEVKASSTEPKEEGQQTLFRFGFKIEILEAKPLNKDIDPETLVGKNLTESYTLWPDNIVEAIGLLKGRYKLVGLDYNGRLGGVEGEEPGWLDNMVGHIFRVRVRRVEIKGTERAFYDWLPAEDNKAESEAA